MIREKHRQREVTSATIGAIFCFSFEMCSVALANCHKWSIKYKKIYILSFPWQYFTTDSERERDVHTLHAQRQQIGFGMYLHTRHPSLIFGCDISDGNTNTSLQVILAPQHCNITLFFENNPLWLCKLLTTWGLVNFVLVVVVVLRFLCSCVLQLKSFHNELLTELEKKVELDARYLNVRFLFLIYSYIEIKSHLLIVLVSV